jgi:hypothetical protein
MNLPPLSLPQQQLLDIVTKQLMPRESIPNTPYTSYTDRIIELRDVCLALELPEILDDTGIKVIACLLIDWKMLKLSASEMELVVRIVTNDDILATLQEYDDENELIQQVLEYSPEQLEALENDQQQKPISIEINDQQTYNQAEHDADEEWAELNREFSEHFYPKGFPT